MSDDAHDQIVSLMNENAELKEQLSITKKALQATTKNRDSIFLNLQKLVKEYCEWHCFGCSSTYYGPTPDTKHSLECPKCKKYCVPAKLVGSLEAA